MSDARRIAVVKSYDDLILALRARAIELGISRETLDTISGLQAGYTGKLLSFPPVRMFGRVSLGPVLQSMGLVLVVEQDPKAIERLQHRYIKRSPLGVRAITRIVNARWLFDEKKARRMGKKRWQGVSQDKRIRWAKRAARKRWKRRRDARTIVAEDRIANTSPAILPRAQEPQNPQPLSAGTGAVTGQAPPRCGGRKA